MSTEVAATSQLKRHGWVFRTARLLFLLIGGGALLLLTVWATAAIGIDCRVSWLRAPAATCYFLSMVAAWICWRVRWQAVGVTIAGFGLVLAWWSTLAPSNDRDWQPDVAVLPYSEISGDTVTLHNIRNCEYRSETDYDVHYYERVFDLRKLRSADLYMVYWGSPYMAHTMVSFGFEGDNYVCFSIETRKVKGQSYSAVRGLFRQFQLTYVVADERDLVRLRTNYRQGEEVYLFRLRTTPERLRRSFLEYLRRVNSLRQQPQWYNAITQNCTTSMRSQHAAAERAPWDWRMLVNGYGDQLLYERGLINTNIPLAELKRRAHINQRAKAAADAADFSVQIRREVPGPDDT